VTSFALSLEPAVTPTAAPGPQLLFVIPAYNEEENLPTLLEDLEQTLGLLGSGSRILIVDDGSDDATAAIARAYSGPLPVDLVQLEQNSGPGAAFRAGFAAALALAHADALIVTLEADTTSDLGALAGMIERARGGADVVLADWQMVNVSAHRRLLSAGAGFVVRHGLGLQSNTVSSFFRVYRASTLRRAHAYFGDLLIREAGFACKAELLGKLSSLGASVEEVPVALDWSRRAGESKMPVLRTMFGYWRMLVRQRSDARGALLAQEAVNAQEALGA
jgi:dolichol-phosphate mannosyltransferase